MKRFTFDIDQRQVNEVFAPIRSKVQVINLLMKTIKIMLINTNLDDRLKKGTIILNVDKMNRLFFISKNKYFSINFPFHVVDTDGQVRFYSKHINDIDNKITSDVISVISNNLALESNDILEFVQSVDEISYLNFWSFMRALFLFEDGYVRYDHDKKNQKELLHPLNHLDIFYSSSTTFKIGLNNKISPESLIDCLDLKSNCHFLDTK